MLQSKMSPVVTVIVCVLLSQDNFLLALPLPNLWNFSTTTTVPNGLPRDVKDILGNPLKFSFNDSKVYLKRYHYMGPESSDPNMRNLSVTNPQRAHKIAIGRFQRFAKLKVTREMDTDTVQMMLWPRCAMADDNRGTNGKLKVRKKRFSTVFIGKQWQKTHLKYKIQKYPKNDFIVNLRQQKLLAAPNQTEIRAAIKKAFRVWSSVSKLRFKEVKRKADIYLLFVKRKHGDGYPFDGPNGVLAHAFYPQWGGDVHYDDNEAWSLDEKGHNGYNFFQVTVHELGHSFGLYHVPDRKSIMYPFYKFRTNFKLSADDIAGIRFLYP